MKGLISVLLLISFNCQAGDNMEQKTLEAVAKFYKLDIIGQETFRRAQEKYLPEIVKPYIPYFMTWMVLVKDKKFVYRSTF